MPTRLKFVTLHAQDTVHVSVTFRIHLSLKLEPLNKEDPYAVAVLKQSDVVGHIPREISRHVCWFIKLGGNTQVTLHSTKLYQSPIALKGIELLLHVTFGIDPSMHEVLKRLKEHIDTNYKTPDELELKDATKKTNRINQQQNKDPQQGTEDPQSDPPEIIFEDCRDEGLDDEGLDSPETVIEIPE